MYQHFFGFTLPPFSKSLASRDVFVTERHKELNARLAHLFSEHGIGVFTGEIGSGKSTAVRAFLDTVDVNRYALFRLGSPASVPTGLYRDLLNILSQKPPFSAAAMATAIRAAFDTLQSAQRRHPVIILDEAHLLPHALIDPLRILVSAQMDSVCLASVLLIGQPDLKLLLKHAAHAAFDQRVTVRYAFEPLSLADTQAYIKHHLAIAGFKSALLFSDEALIRIFDFTKGIPRRINQLCLTALMAAAIDQKLIIDDNILRRAIADLDQD